MASWAMCMVMTPPAVWMFLNCSLTASPRIGLMMGEMAMFRQSSKDEIRFSALLRVDAGNSVSWGLSSHN